MILSIIDTQHKTSLHYAGYCYAECHVVFIVMVSVMLNVIIFSVVMLNVVAPET